MEYEQYSFSSIHIHWEALSLVLNLSPVAVSCKCQLLASVTHCICADWFWQVAGHILAIGREHKIDINDTDALWGETGISFLILERLETPN